MAAAVADTPGCTATMLAVQNRADGSGASDDKQGMAELFLAPTMMSVLYQLPPILTVL